MKARHEASEVSLMVRESGQVEVRDQIQRVLVVSCAADGVPDVVKHRGGLEKKPRVGREPVYGRELIKERQRNVARVKGMPLVEAEAPSGAQHRLAEQRVRPALMRAAQKVDEQAILEAVDGRDVVDAQVMHERLEDDGARHDHARALRLEALPSFGGAEAHELLNRPRDVVSSRRCAPRRRRERADSANRP